MPTGKVRFFDAAKGFGFIAGEDGQQVYVHASIVGDTELPQGARVEYAVGEGRRGPQALSVRVLNAPQRQTHKPRIPADEMAVIVEDLVKLLDGVGEKLKQGNYPERAKARKLAVMLRQVATDFEG